MKKLLFIAFPLILFSCGQESNKPMTEDQKEKVKEEINPVITQLFECVYQADFEKYLSFWDSTEFTYIINGQQADFKVFKETNKQFWSELEYQKINRLSEKLIIINQESVIYTIIGNDEAKFKNGDILKVDPYAASFLLKKVNGLWKIHHAHGSGQFSNIPKDLLTPAK
jgi:hypothetical protein